jgi:hypothetical protein
MVIVNKITMSLDIKSLYKNIDRLSSQEQNKSRKEYNVTK